MGSAVLRSLMQEQQQKQSRGPGHRTLKVTSSECLPAPSVCPVTLDNSSLAVVCSQESLGVAWQEDLHTHEVSPL